jgi:hypothetical protein
LKRTKRAEDDQQRAIPPRCLSEIESILDEYDAGPLLDGKEVVALLADAWSELTITATPT